MPSPSPCLAPAPAAGPALAAAVSPPALSPVPAPARAPSHPGACPIRDGPHVQVPPGRPGTLTPSVSPAPCLVLCHAHAHALAPCPSSYPCPGRGHSFCRCLRRQKAYCCPFVQRWRRAPALPFLLHNPGARSRGRGEGQGCCCGTQLLAMEIRTCQAPALRRQQALPAVEFERVQNQRARHSASTIPAKQRPELVSIMMQDLICFAATPISAQLFASILEAYIAPQPAHTHTHTQHRNPHLPEH
eukprot:1153051-Pelagomonas_calceolata.AAC.7